MIARYYEASYSGLIYFVTNSFALIVIVSSLSLESGVGYYAVSDKIPALLLANFALIWTVCATIIIYLLLKILVVQHVISTVFGSYMLQACLYISGCMLVNFFTVLFYSKKDFFSPNVIMLLVNILLIIIIPFSNGRIISKEQYVNIYFFGFLLQGLLIAFYFIARYFSVQQFKFPSFISLSPVFRYGLLAFGANTIFFLLYRIDYWFVEKFCSAKDLGNYIQVSKLVQVFMVLPMILASSIFPESASGNKIIVQNQIAMLSRLMILMYFFLCGIVVLLGRGFLPLLYGKTFDNMFIPFLLLIPGIFSLSIISLLAAYFAGQNKVWVNMLSSSVGLICILLGNVLFVEALGIKAAALTSSVGYTTTLIVLFFYFFKDSSGNLRAFDFLFVKHTDFQYLKSLFFKKKFL